MPDIRTRRKALGLSRQQLAAKARVDTAILQLIEVGESTDEEQIRPVLEALDAEEQRIKSEGNGTIGDA